MGADMILSSIPSCDLTDDRVAALVALCDSLPVPEWPAKCGTTAEEYREQMRQVICDLPQREDYRDVTAFCIEGAAYDVLVTGGLSWGDPATESMDTFDQINEAIPIYNQLREWAIEDRQPQS